MSIQGMFNKQKSGAIHTQNVMLQNKQRNVQKFSAFDNNVFDLLNKSKGSSYDDICERLAYDPRQTLEKQFRQSFVNYMKVLALSICEKIDINGITNANNAVVAITEAMNDGGFETGMLTLTPWIIECAKAYAKIESRRNCRDQKDWLEVIDSCDSFMRAFGEGVSIMTVSQCIASCLTYNRNLYNMLLNQVDLIKTACTYHVCGKLQIGANMKYDNALNIFVNCICNNPQSFKLYGTFIKMFQNTQHHIIYYIGSQLAVDGIRLIRKMQNQGRNKIFEEQLQLIGGAGDFHEIFQDIDRKQHCMNAAFNVGDAVSRGNANMNIDINNLLRSFNNF